ncbi:beta-lactamase/transpeptidase-like protein [Xylariomycetidae sp. FL2044]|nr:beta-lactamase/transpeptidase-like protein [Xylariomycetidae sp. FL2044]
MLGSLIAAQIASVAGIANCPFPGPAFPKPTNLAESNVINTAIANLTATFNARGADIDTNPNGTSWAIQVFSASSEEPVWENYHTALNLLGVDTPGTEAIEAGTVFRLGSVTKIFTILNFLIHAGDGYWNTPVTSFIPELNLLADKAQYDSIMNTAWDEITLGNLASHMAGIVRDYGIQGELTQENNQTVLMAQGFPPAPVNETPVCGEVRPCSRAQFFAGIANVPPSFAPSRNAAYSNLAYHLLGYALEAITSRNFTEMLETDIINKLGLQRTFYTKPPDEYGVIPPGAENGWAYDLGEARPTGNMYSSVVDLSIVGRAIFRNTLIPGSLTRRWLKPAGLTAEIYEGISYPWGIRRIPLSGVDGNRIVDAYSKAGSINVYSSLMVLLPDYEVGFNALLAGGWPGNSNWDIADAIGAVLLPALEEAAREQARAMYEGTYDAADGALNSSLTLSVDDVRPGLGVDRWVSNGTDMIPVAVQHHLNYNVTGPAVRLYPTGLEMTNDDGSRRVAFKAMVENLDAPDYGDRMFSTNCGTWVSQTTAVYANMPLDQFVFTISAEGAVIDVQPLALRATLVRSVTV